MISAGQDPKVNEYNKTVDITCASFLEEAEPNGYRTCHDNVDAAIKAEKPEELNPVQSFAATQYLMVGRGSVTVDCANRTSTHFGKGGVTPDKYGPFAACMRSRGIHDATTNFAGEAMPFTSVFIPKAFEMARKAGLQDNKFPMPASLIKFIDAIKGIDGGFFANEARRMYREAIARTPVDQRLAAAQKLADQIGRINEDATDPALKYEGKIGEMIAEFNLATTDADKRKVKDDTIRTFVSKVGPAKDYVITWGMMPADIIVKVFGSKNVDPKLVKALRALYADAMKKYYDNGGDPEKEESVKEPFIVAVKAQGIDKDSDVRQIKRLRVVDVPLNADNSARSVELGVRKAAVAPTGLLDIAGHDELLREAIQMLWTDVMEFADDNDVTVTPALIDGMVASLKKPEKDGGIEGMSATQVASQYPTNIGSNGAVKLDAATQNLFHSWKKVKELPDPSASTSATGYLGMHRVLVRILKDAIADEWDKGAAENAIDNWVQMIKEEENDAQKASARILNASYGGRDGTKMIIKEGTGEKVKVEGDGPVGAISDDVKTGMFADLTIGKIFGGPNPGPTIAVDAHPFVIWDPKEENPEDKSTPKFSVKVDVAGRWYYQPSVYGVPGRDAAVMTSMDDGGYEVKGLSAASVTPSVKVLDESLRLSLPLGFINSGMYDGGALGFNSLEDPANGYQPMNASSSRFVGAALMANYNTEGKPVTYPDHLTGDDESSVFGLEGRVLGGSSKASVAESENTGMWGSRIGLDLALNFAPCTNSNAVDCKVRTGFGFGKSWGDVEEGDQALDRRVMLTGLSGLIQFTEHFILDGGLRLGWLDQERKPTDSFRWSIGLGAHLPFYIDGQKGKITPWARVSYTNNKGEFGVANGSAGNGSECVEGFTCNDGDDVTSVEGPDATSLGPRESVMMGDQVIGAMLGVTYDPRKWLHFTLGGGFLPHSEHETGDWETAGTVFMNSALSF